MPMSLPGSCAVTASYNSILSFTVQDLIFNFHCFQLKLDKYARETNLKTKSRIITNRIFIKEANFCHSQPSKYQLKQVWVFCYNKGASQEKMVCLSGECILYRVQRALFILNNNKKMLLVCQGKCYSTAKLSIKCVLNGYLNSIFIPQMCSNICRLHWIQSKCPFLQTSV